MPLVKQLTLFDCVHMRFTGNLAALEAALHIVQQTHGSISRQDYVCMLWSQA